MDAYHGLTPRQVLDKRLPPGTCLDLHVHWTDSLTLVLEGELQEQFGSLRVRVPRWHLLYKRAHIPHTSEAYGGWTRMLILTHVQPPRRSAPEVREQPHVLTVGSLSALALSLLSPVADPGRAARVPPSRVLASLRDRLQENRTGAPEWIQETVHGVRNRPATEAGLSRRAACCSVHRVHLARVFRRYMGCSLGQFVHRCRVDTAVGRLIQSDVPLCDLALDLGYHDQSHFSRHFLRETGWTPGRFRRAVRTLQAA